MKNKKHRQKQSNLFDNGIAQFSVYKVSEGGPGYSVLEDLRFADIPARKSYSPYVGQVGVEVPRKFRDKANKIIFPYD